MNPPEYTTLMRVGTTLLPPGLWLDDMQLKLVRELSASGRYPLEIIREKFPNCPQYIDTIEEEGVTIHRYNNGYNRGGLARIRSGHQVITVDGVIRDDPRVLKPRVTDTALEKLVDNLFKGFDGLKKHIRKGGSTMYWQ